MYDNGEGFSLGKLIVTILLIALVFCILIWIFPTKKDLKDINVEVTKSDNFNNNMLIYKSASNTYSHYITLPKNVNDSVTASLKELLNKKMLLELKDEDGNACDSEKSYVQYTKKSSSEYEMKNYLKCGDEEDYVVSMVVYAVAYKEEKEEPTDEPTEEPTEEDLKYKYLYSCPGNKTNTWSDWSDWSTKEVSKTSTREVKTKTVKENKYVKTGTTSKPVTKYETQTVEKTYTVKPSNASCYSVPKNGYTEYVCNVTSQVPVVTYVKEDVYGWKELNVTYYSYRTLTSKSEPVNLWSFDKNNQSLLDLGCKIIKSELYEK